MRIKRLQKKTLLSPRKLIKYKLDALKGFIMAGELEKKILKILKDSYKEGDFY